MSRTKAALLAAIFAAGYGAIHAQAAYIYFTDNPNETITVDFGGFSYAQLLNDDTVVTYGNYIGLTQTFSEGSTLQFYGSHNYSPDYAPQHVLFTEPDNPSLVSDELRLVMGPTVYIYGQYHESLYVYFTSYTGSLPTVASFNDPNAIVWNEAWPNPQGHMEYMFTSSTLPVHGLVIFPAPEPASLTLLALGAGGLLLRRRAHGPNSR